MAKKRVAILGGGVAAVTVALRLTDDPNWRDQFESVTIYQLGWRLGGKGATGRASDHARILEHGLHIWLGYYENAFRLIQEVYTEARRPPGSPIGTWNDAFSGQNDVGVMEYYDGAWSPWLVHVTPNNGEPGHGVVDSLSVCIGKGLLLLAAKWNEFVLMTAEAKIAPDIGARLSELAKAPNDTADKDGLIGILKELINRAQKYLDRPATLTMQQRRLLMLIEMGATLLLGLLSDNIQSYDDLERLEGIDLARWLAQFNPYPWISDLTQNPLLRGMYDFAFAYENGEVGRPNFAAAPALRTIFRMCLTYKGSIFYKMNGGMGDTIFAPIYEVLCNRGVNVQFFHKVNSLELSADRTRVARIHIGRQATVKPEIGKYQPLVPTVVDTGSLPLPCWPDHPCYDQLVEGETLCNSKVNLESFWSTWADVGEVKLEVGKDFDVAVFGISIGSVQYLCHDFIVASAAWKEMAANVATVSTQSLQLWLKPNIKQLGWCGPSPMLDAWVEPLSTWADMTDIMAFENWGSHRPGSLAYFCGPMQGGIPGQGVVGFPALAEAEVDAAADDMLKGDIQTLWPSVPRSGLPASDVVARFTRASVDPSERYVLSVAGSAGYRLAANGSGFANLVITGDWIQNGYNGGCVEAAVWSGIQAANTILGRPLNSGVITG